MPRKSAVEPEEEGMTQEPANVAEPYIPKFLRRPPHAPLSPELMAMQRHGFVTIELAKSRDALGDMAKAVYTEDGLRYIYRERPVAVPISVYENLERSHIIGAKAVPNPIFNHEFASIDEVPNFIPKLITEPTYKKRYSVSVRVPKDYEIGLALIKHPTEGAELKSYDPEAYAKYAAAWEDFLKQAREERAKKAAGSSRV